MKKAASLLIAFLAAIPLWAQSITDEERTMTVSELERSRDMLKESVAWLSEDQLDFKSSEDAWSIAECVEHLAISEKAFGDMLKGSLETAADPSKRSEVAMTDGDMLGIIRDRSNKIKTSEPFEPTGKFGTYEETLEAFLEMRNAHIAYMNATQDDLRNRYGQLPFGTIDALQMVLFMSGHTERHTAQIKEIQEHEDFPTEE